VIELDDVVVAADALRVLATRGDDERAWQSVARPTSWTAARTVEHIADGLLFYVGQIARRADRRLPVLRNYGRSRPREEPAVPESLSVCRYLA
jgi:hypothetical protein